MLLSDKGLPILIPLLAPNWDDLYISFSGAQGTAATTSVATIEVQQQGDFWSPDLVILDAESAEKIF